MASFGPTGSRCCPTGFATPNGGVHWCPFRYALLYCRAGLFALHRENLNARRFRLAAAVSV